MQTALHFVVGATGSNLGVTVDVQISSALSCYVISGTHL